MSESVVLTWAMVFSGVWHQTLVHFPGKESSPALGASRAYSAHVCPERKAAGGGKFKSEGSGSELTNFLQGAGRGASEAVMAPGCQENFNKCGLAGPYVFALFYSAFILTWARVHTTEPNFPSKPVFFSKVTAIAGCLACVRWVAVLLAVTRGWWRMALSWWLGILLRHCWRSQSALRICVTLAPWLNRSCDELWDSWVKIYKHFSFPLSRQGCCCICTCSSAFAPALSLYLHSDSEL